jgi:hypothetical protein
MGPALMIGTTPAAGRPAAVTGAALPGPAAGLCASVSALGFGAGGDSADSDTTCSPRNNTNPSVRFSSRCWVWVCGLVAPVSGAPALDATFTLLLTTRYSSVSASTRFMCLSKARNVPSNVRPSFSVTRIRQLMNPIILPDLLPAGIFAVVLS